MRARPTQHGGERLFEHGRTDAFLGPEADPDLVFQRHLIVTDGFHAMPRSHVFKPGPVHLDRQEEGL